MVARQFKFVPHVGVGPLLFGMLRHDVYQVLGQPNWRRGPSEFSTLTREEFAAYNCFIDFELDGQCCSAEFYGDASVFFDGVNLVSMTYKSLVTHLRAKGAAVDEDNDGFRCDDLGIACYAPEVGDPDIPDARVESVFVYKRGYYDESDRHAATLRYNNDN